jgi:hypothetical protein
MFHRKGARSKKRCKRWQSQIAAAYLQRDDVRQVATLALGTGWLAAAIADFFPAKSLFHSANWSLFP